MKYWSDYIIEAKQKYDKGWLGLSFVILEDKELPPEIVLTINYFKAKPRLCVESGDITWVISDNDYGTCIDTLRLTDIDVYDFGAPWESIVNLGAVIKSDYTDRKNDGDEWGGLYCHDSMIHIEEPNRKNKEVKSENVG